VVVLVPRLAHVLCLMALLLCGPVGVASANAADPSPARASTDVFAVKSHSAVYHATTETIRFKVRFDRIPDFLTSDAGGRQADSFQFFIYSDRERQTFESLIRGEEIHVDPAVLRIRNSSGVDPDPASGGWGSIRDVVPYTLHGKCLTFSVPLSVLSDTIADGRIWYSLEVYEYGSWNETVLGASTVKR
jgi:hypothetical protein